MLENIFFQIGVIIIMATIVGFIAKLLKQPLIPAYVIAGVIIGPLALGLINDLNTISTLSEIGIAFLLFVVGLQLDLRKLKDIGMIASVGGSLQIILLFFFGFLVGNILGFGTMTSVYLGMIISFSSTMVVIKLLSDKMELDTLHGRILIGMLLVEDLWAIIGMSILSNIAEFSVVTFLLSVIKGLFIIALMFVLSRSVFPAIFKVAAKSQEMLFLLSLTVCFFFSILAVFFKFSIVVGAFLAGVSLANLPYNLEIVARVKPLRDFFATMFFVTLGTELVIFSSLKILIPLAILAFFVMLVKPFITTIIAAAFGYTKKTAFLTGISLAEISEFGLIIVAQGFNMGHVSQDLLSMTVIIATVTMTFASYTIKYDNKIYSVFSNAISFLDSIGKRKKELRYGETHSKYSSILIGYDRIAYSIGKTLEKLKKSFMVVDFNPDVIKNLMKHKIPCIYGDIGDMEILRRINFRDAEIIISTVPVKKDNMLLLKQIKRETHKALVIVTANRINEALDLYDEGADYVIMPHFLGGHHFSMLLVDITKDLSKLLENKVRHIEELKERQMMGHEHPTNNHQGRDE
ncbi:cation:proton antiporter [Candidatus Woesearchaeota archaeon]|nr:cation:proton antiporter [Candidatus Woesearchaeota archaeon]